MKRFAFWFVISLVALAALRSHRRHDHDFDHEGGHDGPGRVVIQGDHFVSIEGNGKRVVIDHNGLVIDRVRGGETRHVVVNGDGLKVERIPQTNIDVARDDEERPVSVSVDDIPVPIIPGTRVTESIAEPPAPPKPLKGREARAMARAKAQSEADAKVEPLVVAGQLSATEERARKDGFVQFEKAVAAKLQPDVPRTWKLPRKLVEGLRPVVTVSNHPRDYGTMYTAEYKAKFTGRERARLVEAYRHEQRLQKLTVYGGGLAFLLVCLGTLSGYLRAEEATKGYYTNRLRLAAAAGVGAAGVLIYQAVV